MKEIIKKLGGEKPACIEAEDIAGLAKEAVGRALAARQIMTELSAEQAGAVGGGAFLLAPIIAGGPIIRSLSAGLAVPSVPSMPGAFTTFA